MQNSQNTLLEEKAKEAITQRLPHYEMQIIQKTPKFLIGIYCTIGAPVDKETLILLGKHCFEKVHGKSYNEVLINWYIEGSEKKGRPWGVTNTKKNTFEVEIFK